MHLDKEFLKKIKKRDKKAQLLLYDQCFGIMMSSALRYKRNVDDAAALVNESFLKVLVNIKKYDTNKPIEAWIRRIVINTALDDFRKNKKRYEAIFEDQNEPNSNTCVSFNNIESAIEMEYVQEAMNTLSPATRIVFNLYVFDGYSHQEISEKRSITIETSKWHVKEARKKLR
ncbi:MAG: RNA polymerase sigma factor, partial [Flavobacteriales bacterium]|nr:RNA polymerase sigma factor [Flavobacteriales bacterium]